MNYKFDISLPERSDFRAELAIGGEQTFQQLHEKLLDILEHDDSQMTSFHTLNKSGDRVKEITLMDMSMGEDNSNVLVMDSTKIEDVINSTCIELDYIYDFFNDKYLKIEYAGEYIADSADVLPLCLSSVGKPPVLEGDKWELDGDDYDNSFMEEFSDYTKTDGDYEDDEDDFDNDGYGEEEEYGEEDDYGGRHENIDDYLDRI